MCNVKWKTMLFSFGPTFGWMFTKSYCEMWVDSFGNFLEHFPILNVFGLKELAIHNLVGLEFKFHWMYLNSIDLNLNPIHSKFNKIQFKSHAMSFNIFIRMELNFHKINSVFHQLINWLWLVVRSNAKPKLLIEWEHNELLVYPCMKGYVFGLGCVYLAWLGFLDMRLRQNAKKIK
jgi:hypothetical protein